MHFLCYFANNCLKVVCWGILVGFNHNVPDLNQPEAFVACLSTSLSLLTFLSVPTVSYLTKKKHNKQMSTPLIKNIFKNVTAFPAIFVPCNSMRQLTIGSLQGMTESKHNANVR